MLENSLLYYPTKDQMTKPHNHSKKKYAPKYVKTQNFFCIYLIYFLTSLLEYNCFTMVC